MTFGKNLTIFKIIALVLIVACFVMLFLPWLTVKTSIYSAGASYNVFKTGLDGKASSFWSVMLVILAILFILAMYLGVFGILTDRSTLVLPIAVLAFLMFFLAVFQRAFAMSVLTKAATAAMYSLGAANAAMYASGLVTSLTIHVGAGAWLFFFLGLAAVGLVLVDNYTARRPLVNVDDFKLSGVSMPNVSLGGWNCPRCGAALSGSQKFCTQCGTPKPEAPRCPGCGKPVKPGAAFCPSCGTRL